MSETSQRPQEAEPIHLSELRALNQRLADETSRLRESEARKAAILETSLDAIIVIDSEGRVVEFNPAAERIFGYEKRHAVGRLMAELIIPHNRRPSFARGFARALATGKTTLLNRQVEMTALRADGREIIVELAVAPVMPSQPPLFTAYLRDITKRKRLDQRRAARLAVNQVLLEASSLEEAARRILQALCENLQLDVGAIWQVDSSAGVLRCFEIWHQPTAPIPEFEALSRRYKFLPGEGFPGRIWKMRKPTWIADVAGDSNFPRAEAAIKDGLRGAFGFPIMLGPEFLGVVEFFSHSIAEPDEDKLEMADTIGGQLAQFMDRKRTEAAVRSVTNELRIVMEGIAVPVARCGRDLRYHWVSKPYAEWVDRPMEEIVGKPIRDVIGDAAFEQLRPRFEQVLLGQTVQYVEEVNFRRMGRRFISATYTPTLDAEGVANGWVAVVIDITAQKEVEEALRQSEQRFSRFMQHLPGLAWIKDLSGRYVYANAAAKSAFGYPSEAMLGKTDQELFPKETASQFVANDRKALASESGVQMIETLKQSDRDIHHSLVSKFPIRDSKGMPAFVGGMAIDITDRLRAEESLRQADLRKNHFLATLAHELRNPLAPLRTGMEILRIAEGNTALIDQTRAVMERQLGHMVRLIDDLLDISRITRGRLLLQREIVELAPIVRDSIETSRPLIEAFQHTLSVELPDDPIRLDVDPTRLAQIFSNLLNNAAKYSEKGGRISMRAERGETEVAISIRDVGFGISADRLPNIFEMFSHERPHLTESQSGLGVGLSLVRALVELHGGTIEAHSDGLGMGSEFIVRLPIVSLSSPSNSEVDESRDGDGRVPALRILVVDDNADAANSLTTLLRYSGHDVRTAYNGLDALEIAGTFHPAIVLLDLGMPILNGYETAAKIRQQPWGQQMTLIAVSGWGQEEDQHRSLNAGFDHHLTKPVLVDAIDELLGRKS